MVKLEEMKYHIFQLSCLFKSSSSRLFLAARVLERIICSYESLMRTRVGFAINRLCEDQNMNMNVVKIIHESIKRRER